MSAVSGDGEIVKRHVSHIAVFNSCLRPESWHTMWVATLAQLVEHPPCKRTVVGSSPTGGSICRKTLDSHDRSELVKIQRDIDRGKIGF